jgi:hypothetical protein
VKIVSASRAHRDRYAALLRDSLKAMRPETVTSWIVQLETDLHAKESDTADRLEANAMLVGILSVMLEGIDVSNP